MKRAREPLWNCGAGLLVAGLVSACATPPTRIPEPLHLPATAAATGAATPATEAAGEAVTQRMPAPPANSSHVGGVPAASARESAVKGSLNFEAVPIKTLVEHIYADLLGKTVTFDPGVESRRDTVTVRTPPNQSAEDLRRTTELLLKDYGLVAIEQDDNTVKIAQESSKLSALPEIRRGGALPETPASLRPVFQLVELAAVRNSDVAGQLRTMFGDRVSINEDPSRNAVLIGGTADNVRVALEAVQLLDQPVMRDQQSLRLSPRYWSAGDLSRKLTEILAAEGYVMPRSFSADGGVRYPLILLPVDAANYLLVFSRQQKILDHVRDWFVQLDRPTAEASGRAFFTFKPRNTSAEALAATLTQLLGGGNASGGTTDPNAPGAAAAAAKSAIGNGRVVVDKGSNTLIVQAEDQTQIDSLLRALDAPTRSVLIEVTIAEVNLSNDEQLGVEWLLKDTGNYGSSTYSTLGGLGLGTSGLVIKGLDNAGDLRVVINALASSNNAHILSSPSVVARNGEQATITVGQEVPIVTSQQGSINATTGVDTTGVLQSIQYRNTGVILGIKPTIHSDDMIDVQVEQEVSAALSTTTGVNNSPTFSTRKVKTSMALKNGATVLLGGLIASNDTAGDTGIPWLKDIPILGHLFKRSTTSTTRNELLVLITPYIIGTSDEAKAVLDAFKERTPSLAEPKD
jgi:general secretion pathway protein D